MAIEDLTINEIWLPVIGYERWYKVSSWGRVRRVISNPIYEGRCLRAAFTGQGYLKISLCKRGKIAQKYIHHLVAATFIGPRPDGHQVNHIDGNRENNFASNLEYVTPSENQYHSSKMGLMQTGDRHYLKRRPEKALRGERNGCAKLSRFDVEEIRAKYKTGLFTQTVLGKEYAVDRRTILKIVHNQRWRD